MNEQPAQGSPAASAAQPQRGRELLELPHRDRGGGGGGEADRDVVGTGAVLGADDGGEGVGGAPGGEGGDQPGGARPDLLLGGPPPAGGGLVGGDPTQGSPPGP